MKKFTPLFLSLVFCMCIQSHTQAQKHQKKHNDFLVTNNNDTLHGRFQKKIFGQPYFIINGKKLLLDPQTYTAYSTQGKLFRSIQLSTVTDPQWMECLENGKINLYQYVLLNSNHPGSPSTSVIWLAQKGGGPLLNVNGILSSQSVAKENMTTLIIDKNDILKKFNDLPFNTRSIQYIIHEYNNEK